MANTSLQLQNLDFDVFKNSLKSYLASQNVFKDYDFDGSNMSVLLDILAFNTYHNAYYLNMVAAEMFLDSAQIDDSVVSHAKELNYIPRSFSSAYAEVDIVVKSEDSGKTSITIPKGTQFTSKVGDNSFIFTTDENIVVQGQNTFTANNVTIYEGIYVTETFSTSEKITIENSNIDLNSLSVVVIEDNGSTVVEYKRYNSLFEVDDETPAYFVQAARGRKYEITFGDGVIGRIPKNNSIVNIEYRISNGELPNGAQVFRTLGPIDGENDVTVVLQQKAEFGSVSESIDSIKFNAPRHFTTQERAVTSEDFINLLKSNFSEIQAVASYGGEEETPPVYGKVFIAIDLKDTDYLPLAKEKQFKEFLKSRTVVSIEPVFVEPDYTYIKVNSIVNYDLAKTRLNENDIRTLVISSILEYGNQNLNDFNRILRYSRLITNIDDADVSIISNETDIKAMKLLNYADVSDKNVVLRFGFPIVDLTSSVFRYRGQQCQIKNEADKLFIYNADEKVLPIGDVALLTGDISISPFVFDSVFEEIEIIVTPEEKDILSSRNTILSIRDSDIQLEVKKDVK
jgi:hypothetical protein